MGDVGRNFAEQKVAMFGGEKSQQNGAAKNAISVADEDVQPPDGGTRAWLIMMGSFFCNGILFGVINSYGVLYSELYHNLEAQNISNAASKASLVGSLGLGTTFLISPISGILTDMIGIRMTTFLGGVIAASGMFLSSFVTKNINALYFTYGIMYGLGGSLAYTPSLVILGHYFKKRLGLVNGIVTAGSSVFTIAMPYLIDGCLRGSGINWTLRVLSLLAACIIACSYLFKPLVKKKKAVTASNAFNWSIWKNKRYVIWATVIPISLFGYFVPYVHMLSFVEENFGKDADGKMPVMCIGITSGLGRLIFGYVADKPRVNRILLQQVSFLCIGLLTIILPFTKGSYGFLLFVALCMGIFDGAFISILGPIAFDICGKEGASQAIGFLLGLCSIPLTVGPYAAGMIFDATKSYKVPFRLAGIPPILGAAAMFLIRLVKTPSESSEDEEARQSLKSSKADGLAKLASAETLGSNPDE